MCWSLDLGGLQQSRLDPVEIRFVHLEQTTENLEARPGKMSIAPSLQLDRNVDQSFFPTDDLRPWSAQELCPQAREAIAQTGAGGLRRAASLGWLTKKRVLIAQKTQLYMCRRGFLFAAGRST